MWRSARRFRRPPELDVHDVRDLLVAERVEDHDLVHAVEELGPEMCAQDRPSRARVIGASSLARELLDELAADVARS